MPQVGSSVSAHFFLILPSAILFWYAKEKITKAGENGKKKLQQKNAKEAPLPFAHHSHVISHFHFDESANFDTFQHVVTVSVG